MACNKRQVRLAHPGEILNEEFLKPLGMTVNALAVALHVPGNRLYAVVDGVRGISLYTALRLGRYFGTGPEFWVNLQAHYDLESTKVYLEEENERQVQPRDHAAYSRPHCKIFFASQTCPLDTLTVARVDIRA